jgi:hypothetical protein
MSLEFGLILTGYGVLAMFSAIAVIIIACEILKRKFKEAEVETTPTDALVAETPRA